MTGSQCVCLLAGLPFALAAQDYPAFDQFRVTEVFSAKPALPEIRTPDERMFRTAIRSQARNGPNFAGRFTIAQWGCGAGCVSMVVIDAANGRIYRGPFQVLAWQLLRYEGRYPSNGDTFEPLEFQKGSRLLIARGCPEEKDCASYFYEWTGAGFKLLRKVAALAVPQ